MYIYYIPKLRLLIYTLYYFLSFVRFKIRRFVQQQKQPREEVHRKNAFSQVSDHFTENQISVYSINTIQ